MQDLKYALRFLVSRWGISSVAVVIMSLGISLTATMFAIIDGVVLSGPDYPDLEEIVYLETTISQSEFTQSVRVHDYLDWRDQQTVFEEMGAYYGTSANLSGDGARAESFVGVRLTASNFDLLDARPFMGRGLTAEDDFLVDNDVVVIGYHLWVNRFDRDPDIIGKVVRVNARPTTVVGVMPEGFRFPELHDMWMPLNIDPGALERGTGRSLAVIARLSDGVTEEEALAQLTGIATRITQQYPVANRDVVPVMESWIDAQFVDAETKGLLYTMLVAVIGVLLIACANVANLLFGTTIARGKELAVRTAMGASRTRVLTQLLIESMVLALGGAVLGTILSKFSLELFTSVVVGLGPPPWMVFELSPTVLGFVVGVTFLSALASGILPAVLATRTDVNAALQDQSRGSSSRSVGRWSTILVGMEVALSCALLVGAGLMVRSTIEVSSSDFGLNKQGIMTSRVILPGETYPDSLARRETNDLLLTELRALPGVREVALASSLPVMGTGYVFYGVRDREYLNDGEYSFSGYTHVSPDFFDILDVSMVAGRGFDATDDMGGERLVIVDERFSELNWPGEDALGRQVRLGRSDSTNPWLTVIGVVETIAMSEPGDFGAAAPEGMFVPITQQPINGISIMLRGDGDPEAFAQPVRDLIARIDPDLPVNQVNTLEARIAEQSLQWVIIGGMFAIFGVVALILASVGLYAVMSFSVSRRKTEVGIRMALGAQRGKIIRLIVGQGSRPLAGGLAVGLVLAFLLAKALGAFLFNVGTLDPLTYVGVPVLLTIVSLVALMVPAGRASRITPVAALRED
jgi:putative ABC transport system permease protein